MTTNRLIHETSPYLLQHAHHPVDWYPWGPEALARARTEDKPILLSVGYSACHWCHVMAHESFELPAAAALMNEHFINIKVDREERPDIDAIYMEAVQAMTGHGGWPMTVFLTPDGKPFYGGTYFPPAPRHDMPGFSQLLSAIADAWRERRSELLASGERLAEALARTRRLGSPDTPLTPALLDAAAREMLRSFDRDRGGFGGAPKFPQPMNLAFLLAYAARTGDAAARHAVCFTLDQMAAGGIYDQLGGGFHRYSTDAAWLVPHFEKMLYDNAQLARVYLHAWQFTGEPRYRRVVEAILDYVLAEMTAPAGAFYSTQDADSEGVEGKFFLWTPAQLAARLGAADARLVAAYFDVTERGNFHEGGPAANILHTPRAAEAVAAELGVSPQQVTAAVERARPLLFAARAGRIPPGRDDKILTEWNGLMLAAFAEAGATFDRPDYVAAAERAAHFILTHMVEPPAEAAPTAIRLYRTYNAGRGHLNAYLEDYAALALGLLALYQATFELQWLRGAERLTETLLARFGDPHAAGFFQTAHDHERLIVRRKDFIDSATPAGNSLAAELLLRLAKLLQRPAYIEPAVSLFQRMAEALAQQPLAFGHLLAALDFHLHGGPEIAIIGAAAAADTRSLLTAARRGFLPNSVLAGAAEEDAEAAQFIPLLAGRGRIAGRATAYVCRDNTCGLPVTEPEALRAQLGVA